MKRLQQKCPLTYTKAARLLRHLYTVDLKNGVRPAIPACIEMVDRALLSLPSNSIEANSFSAAGLFIMKLRAKLSDKLIDDLFSAFPLFLKSP